MSECYKNKYIFDSKIYFSSSFNENILNANNVVYEVVRLVNSKIIDFDANYIRLQNSLKIIGFECPFSKEKLEKEIENLATLNDVSCGNTKLLFFERENKLSYMIFFIQHYYPNEDEVRNGVKCSFMDAVRPNPNAKIINNDLRGRANNLIKEKQVFEMILINDNGFITEGSRSNLFFIKDNSITTCPNELVLRGTVRKRLIKLCQINKIAVNYQLISKDEAKDYDAAFLTGTSLNILPINSIDDFSFDCNNSLLRFLQEEYLKLIKLKC